jgi:hypothetical protein
LTPSLLVAGSFAPDMTYYAASVLPGAMEFGTVTHSFTGVFTVDVLIAWTLAAAWLLVREPLVALLPRSRQGRWAALTRCATPRARVRPASAPWWYVSAALGALTHVVWDAFTHFDRWGTRVFPVLGRPLAGAPLYWYLQYGGSAVAAVVIAAFVTHALRRAPAGEPAGVPALSSRDRWWSAAVIGGCAGAGAARRAAQWWAGRGPSADVRELVPVLCFGAGAGLVVGVVAYAAGVRAWRPVGRVPGGGDGGAARGAPDAAGAVTGRSDAR